MRSLKIFYIVAISLLVIYLVAEFNRPVAVIWKPTLSYQDKIPFGTYVLYHEIHSIFGDTKVTGTNSTFYDQFHSDNDSTAVPADTAGTTVHTDTASTIVHNKQDSVSVQGETDSATVHSNTGDTVVYINRDSTPAHSYADSAAIHSNYIIIAGVVNMSKLDYREMVKYMENGNSIFIATNGFMQTGFKPSPLADTLKIEISNAPMIAKNNAILNFTNRKLKHAGGYHFDRGVASRYFESFDTTRAVVLSQNESGQATLLRYKFGKGSLILCANPELFTNYSMLKGDGADYAAKVLSYMPAQPVIYWDHRQNGDIPEDESPVRVFFSYPSLRWAYYIALLGMVIFVLYEKKRRQRIIPVLAPLANSTVDFVNVVGRVYYEQRNNTNIAQKKILYFLEYLRNTYYLRTNRLDKEFIEKLAQKTGVDFEFASQLVAHIHYVTGQRVSDMDLIKLNQLIEQFYIKSR